MPVVQVGEWSRDVILYGSVWDHSDLLASLVRADLRSFVDGPWGKGDEKLAAEMIRRCSTDPCVQQCFVVQHAEGQKTMRGCSCSSGWQYTDDNHVQALEGCPPNDVWRDTRALVSNHIKIGRGDNDPILCDCDDLTSVCAACAKFERWDRAGRKTKDGRPVDGPEDIRVAITKPPDANTAHAFMLCDTRPIAGEPEIMIRPPPTPKEKEKDPPRLYVFDPAGRWGMRRPDPSYYGRGDVAVFPVRFSDL